MPKFSVGNRVVDRDGYRGTITKITHHDGAHWYDVRIWAQPSGLLAARWDGTRLVGEAVRYDGDLSLDI